MSLRVKLVLWYSVVFALSGCFLTTGLYLLIVRAMRAEADKFIDEEFEELRRFAIANADAPARIREEVRAEIEQERHFPIFYRLYDAAAARDIVALAATELQEAIAAVPPIEAVPQERRYTTIEVGQTARPIRVLTGPLDLKRHPDLVIQIGMYNRWLDKRSASLQKYLAMVLVAVLLFATVGGWLLASHSLKPIDKIVSELSKIESTSLASRLEVGASGGEVDRLRAAINRMLERLNAAFDRLQSFTADAAHELRTPIAALQCRLEVALNKPRDAAELREALSEVLHQVSDLQALVDNMLFLARMDAQIELPDVAPVDLCALLAEVADPFALLAEQQGVALSVRCRQPIQVQGNPVFLRRIIGNLLDNAVRYTPAGGSVVAEAKRDGAGCVVTVTDTGIGIAPEALGRVFDRFYRADESRSRTAGGAGLGLSIVKRAVELHRGSVTIQSQQGKGTTVTVSLPCASA